MNSNIHLVTFIGGPWDGHKVTVDTSTITIRVPDIDEDLSAMAPKQHVYAKTTLYEYRLFPSPKGTWLAE